VTWRCFPSLAKVRTIRLVLLQASRTTPLACQDNHRMSYQFKFSPVTNLSKQTAQLQNIRLITQLYDGWLFKMVNADFKSCFSTRVIAASSHIPASCSITLPLSTHKRIKRPVAITSLVYSCAFSPKSMS
jgi:hypothetical protein